MIGSDFTRYLHLHRVRTVLQLITPEHETGCPSWDRKTLQEFRDVPGAAFKRAHERQVGAVGGYTWAVDRLGGLQRTYGGRVHLVDTGNGQEFNLHTVHPVGKRESGEDGSSAPLACGFVGNWRYLVVATGNVLSCYDVERGAETCRLRITGAPKQATLGVGRVGNSAYVALQTEKARTYYRVVVAK